MRKTDENTNPEPAEELEQKPSETETTSGQASTTSQDTSPDPEAKPADEPTEEEKPLGDPLPESENPAFAVAEREEVKRLLDLNRTWDDYITEAAQNNPGWKLDDLEKDRVAWHERNGLTEYFSFPWGEGMPPRNDPEDEPESN